MEKVEKIVKTRRGLKPEKNWKGQNTLYVSEYSVVLKVELFSTLLLVLVLLLLVFFTSYWLFSPVSPNTGHVFRKETFLGTSTEFLYNCTQESLIHYKPIIISIDIVCTHEKEAKHAKKKNAGASTSARLDYNTTGQVLWYPESIIIIIWLYTVDTIQESWLFSCPFSFTIQPLHFSEQKQNSNTL